VCACCYLLFRFRVASASLVRIVVSMSEPVKHKVSAHSTQRAKKRRRTIRFAIFLNGPERNALEAEAERSGLSSSDVLRMYIRSLIPASSKAA
jgi:hypothetical protein